MSTDELVFTDYIRKPFEVEAVEITHHNLAVCATLIGNLAVETNMNGPDTVYILINRDVIPNLRRANVGWFLTQMNGQYRCYSPEIFAELFMPTTVENSDLFDRLLGGNEAVSLDG